MLSTEEMRKLDVLFIGDRADSVINGLQRMGCVQVKNVETTGDYLTTFYSKERVRDDYSTLFARSARLAKIFRDYGKQENILESLFGPMEEKRIALTEATAEYNIRNADKLLSHIEGSLDGHLQRHESLLRESDDLKKKLGELELIKDIEIEPETLRGLGTVFLFVGISKIKNSKKILVELKKHDDIYINEKFIGSLKDSLMFVMGMKERMEEVKGVLSLYGFRFFRLDEYEKSPRLEYEAASKRLAEIKDSAGGNDAKIRSLVERWHERLAILSAVLETYTKRDDAYRKLMMTESVAALECFVPAKKVCMVEAALRKSTNDVFYISESKCDDAPSIIMNPRGIRGFEVFTKCYGLPDYKNADPTFYMAVFIPIFFGLMIGDAGYGIMITVFSFALRKFFKNSTAKSFSFILAISGGVAVVFGILFGSFFGNTGILSPLWFDPSKDPVMLLLTAAMLGLTHMTVGVSVSIMQNIKLRRSVISDVAWLFVEAGGFVGLCVFFGAMPKEFMFPGLIVFGIGAAEKMRRPIEITGIMSYAGNILSYLRLAAIALTSVYIGFLVNMFTAMFSGVSVALAGVIFIAGHSFNCIISTAGSLINSMRLHYVEFFGRFYSGSGEEFKPLTYGTAIIEEV
jgi:V/A-type H+/Na+-transporting ATPase subunit I